MCKEAIVKYSVVIPAYNRHQTIAACIRSVITQTKPPAEVILVDDGSTDSTVAIARDTNPSIRILSTEGRRGACFARNLGAFHATNPWIAFQDSDDVWLPRKQEIHCGVLKRFDAEVVFGPFISITDGKEKIKALPYMAGDRTHDCILSSDSTRALLFENCVSTQTLMLSKQRLNAAGGFNTALKRFQDWDLAIRLSMNGPLAYAAEPLVRVQQQHDSLSRVYDAGLDSRYHFLETYTDQYRADRAAAAKMWQSIAIREAARKSPLRAIRACKESFRVQFGKTLKKGSR